jgi:hypothetical protein
LETGLVSIDDFGTDVFFPIEAGWITGNDDTGNGNGLGVVGTLVGLCMGVTGSPQAHVRRNDARDCNIKHTGDGNNPFRPIISN